MSSAIVTAADVMRSTIAALVPQYEPTVLYKLVSPDFALEDAVLRPGVSSSMRLFQVTPSVEASLSTWNGGSDMVDQRVFVDVLYYVPSGDSLRGHRILNEYAAADAGYIAARMRNLPGPLQWPAGVDRVVQGGAASLNPTGTADLWMLTIPLDVAITIGVG